MSGNYKSVSTNAEIVSGNNKSVSTNDIPGSINYADLDLQSQGTLSNNNLMQWIHLGVQCEDSTIRWTCEFIKIQNKGLFFI